MKHFPAARKIVTSSNISWLPSKKFEKHKV